MGWWKRRDHRALEAVQTGAMERCRQIQARRLLKVLLAAAVALKMTTITVTTPATATEVSSMIRRNDG